MIKLILISTSVLSKINFIVYSRMKKKYLNLLKYFKNVYSIRTMCSLFISLSALDQNREKRKSCLNYLSVYL